MGCVQALTKRPRHDEMLFASIVSASTIFLTLANAAQSF